MCFNMEALRESKNSLKKIILSAVEEVKNQKDGQISYQCCANAKNGRRCNYAQKALVPSNFKRHFICNHPEVASNLGIHESQTGEPSTKKAKMSKIPVETNRAYIILGTLTLATSNSLPLRYPDWDGMKILVGPIWKAVNIPMNRVRLTEMIGRAAKIMRELMIAEMRGKPIHVKIDSASRRGRSVFGINVQFANEDHVTVRHLALHEMIERQTKENLKNVMEYEFHEFGITCDQVLTVAHDNGANMVASVKLLKRFVDSCEGEHGLSVGSILQNEKAMIEAHLTTCSNEDADSDYDDDDEELGMSNDVNGVTTDDFDMDVEADTCDDSFEVEDSEVIEIDLMESTRCAAHTAQLAVWDVIKPFKSRLAKINQVCIKMRHKEFQQLFHIHKYPVPPKVVETRWNVWHIVLKYLLNLRASPFLPTLEKTDASLDLSKQWQFIEKFCSAFEPLFDLTLRLQKEHVPLSQFYADWLVCQAKLDVIKEGNTLAVKLLKCMQNRIKKLSSTKIFKASLYLDPRFNFVGSGRLSPADKKEAQEYLLALDSRLDKITGVKMQPSDDKENISQSSDFVEDYLTDFFEEYSSSSVQSQASNDSLLIDLIKLETREKVNITSRQSQSGVGAEIFDIVAHWNKRMFANPRLHRLAMAVFSAPSTQVTVERLFSRMKLILSDCRMKLSDVTLKNLMLLKMNSDLLPKVAEILDQSMPALGGRVPARKEKLIKSAKLSELDSSVGDNGLPVGNRGDNELELNT